jgi:hypothetical protein
MYVPKGSIEGEEKDSQYRALRPWISTGDPGLEAQLAHKKKGDY